MLKFLKERRIELGKELSEIAEATNIRSAYLRAIEEEEFEKLPVEVYTRGYIKEYTKFLGMPADLALESYEKFLAEKKVRKEKYHEKKAALLPKELVESLEALKGREGLDEVAPGSSDKKIPFVMILSVILAVVIATGVYFLISAGEKAAHSNLASPSAAGNPQSAPKFTGSEPVKQPAN